MCFNSQLRHFNVWFFFSFQKLCVLASVEISLTSKLKGTQSTISNRNIVPVFWSFIILEISSFSGSVPFALLAYAPICELGPLYVWLNVYVVIYLLFFLPFLHFRSLLSSLQRFIFFGWG